MSVEVCVRDVVGWVGGCTCVIYRCKDVTLLCGYGQLVYAHTPQVFSIPNTLSGDLSVLATFILLKVIDFGGCHLVTGRCGGGEGR